MGLILRARDFRQDRWAHIMLVVEPDEWIPLLLQYLFHIFILKFGLIHHRDRPVWEFLNLLCSPLLIWKCIVVLIEKHLLLLFMGWHQRWKILVRVVRVILDKLLMFLIKWKANILWWLWEIKLGILRFRLIQWNCWLSESAETHLTIKLVFAWEENYSRANWLI